MKKILILLGLFLSVYGFAQQPQIRYKVNVERDTNGNIIRYDSTYVMTWSSNGDAPVDIDSLMQSMGIVIRPFSEDDSFMQDFMMPGFGMPYTTPDGNSYLSEMQEMMQRMEEMHKRMIEEMENMQKMYGLPPSQPFAVPDTTSEEEIKRQKLRSNSVSL